MLKKFIFAGIFTSTLFLTGCAVPGGHIVGLSGSDLESSDKLNDNVLVQEITPLLISELPKQAIKASSNPKLDQELQAYDYLVGVGDVLNITVWDHPELTIPAGSYRDAASAGNWVHADGTIFYPYVGKIDVVGQSTSAIRTTLQKRLGRFIENPQVDVTVAAFRSQRAYVTGEVNQPGMQAITNIPKTLLDAVNQAGGLGVRADWRNVTLTQGDKEEIIDLYSLYQKGDIAQNRLLHHNDVVHVPRNDALKVFVMGEVDKPETLMMERNGMTLAEALSSTGGFNESTADASGIFVLRNDPAAEKPIQVYQLNARNTAAMVLATRFMLKPYDVVYVTAMPISRWNRVINQLLPTINGIDTIGDNTSWY
jgi:polysaccharide export outer membrane protein